MSSEFTYDVISARYDVIYARLCNIYVRLVFTGGGEVCAIYFFIAGSCSGSHSECQK